MAISLAKLPPVTTADADRKRSRRACMVVWLRDIEGLTEAETAREIGRSGRRVRQLLAEGRALVPPRVVEALRRLVAELDAEDAAAGVGA